MVDEGVQVHGMIAVLDFSDYNVKFQSAVSIEERKQFIQSWQVQPGDDCQCLDLSLCNHCRCFCKKSLLTVKRVFFTIVYMYV